MSDRAALTSAGLGATALLHEMSEALEVGAMTVDHDLVIRSWNAWLESASGLSAAAVVGRPLLEVFPEMADGQRETAFRRALGGGAVVLSHRLHRYLIPLPAPSGTTGFAMMQQRARIVPVLRDDLSVEGAVAFVQDVSDRVEREEALRAAMERAEAASQAKSDFLASISHELRTPLSAVVGYADLLSMELSGPVLPEQQQHLERIKHCAWHLLSIVEEILSFSRTEAGKEPIDLVETDARQILHDAIILLEPQAAKKGLALSSSQPYEPVPMLTDPTKVRQILVNLVGNAIKFTDVGSISVTLEADDERVTFRVRDTGPGIAANQQARIFEAFTQLDQSRTREKGGTGLGLPLSRNLSQLLGGGLEVESAVGAGSTFTVTLARRAPRESEPKLPVPEATTRAL